MKKKKYYFYIWDLRHLKDINSSGVSDIKEDINHQICPMLYTSWGDRKDIIISKRYDSLRIYPYGLLSEIMLTF